MNKAPRKMGNENQSYIPEEIITNILIRLPVKSLVRFQLVSKSWRDVISVRDFLDLHQRNSIPIILVSSTWGTSCFKIFAVDKWWDWDVSRMRIMIHEFPSSAPEFSSASLNPFSHSGMIVVSGSCFSEPDPTSVILNPARPSDQCVRIKYSKYFCGDICAVYYHPSLDEYCTLWRIRISGSSADEPDLIQYKVLNLGSDPSFKMISDAFTYRFKDSSHVYPLLINDHLYWMLESEQASTDGHNDILEFDIISEEFRVIPCPIPLSTKCRLHETQLLISDGILSIILILPSTITIWELKDHELHLWTATEYTINVDGCHIHFTVRIIACLNGMLACEYKGILFVCNLREGTMKQYPKKYGGQVLFLSHQMSLASLKKCKAELSIDKDGKVFV